ncbi:MAG: DNA-processing protein DprA [Bacteroidota bacterium]|nr:DNA-processing protein DprA [Bacteroidota bacterium]
MVNIYELAFSKIYGIGAKTALDLLNKIPSPEDLFAMKRKDLQTIFSKERTIQDILNKTMFHQCERELNFLEKNNIRSYFVTHSSYPKNLKNIPDPPICLFVDGKGEFDNKHIVSIVGSRMATPYGQAMTEQIVQELKKLDVIIISGLAFGIDSASHRAALKNDIPTFAVLGHGLDRIYPSQHYTLAQSMKERGGLISEFFTGTNVSPYTFPQRNRIIAGISDLVIVVEAAKKGGALITARLANDYNREVFALPGRVGDKYSEGCNFLIYSSRAHILSSFKNISSLMSWEEEEKMVFEPIATQENNIITIDKSSTLPDKQKNIYTTLINKGEMDIDTLALECKISINELSALLLEMELEDYVLSKPGKIYKAL